MSSATAGVRIALVGDQNAALPSHRECGAVRGMLGDDVQTEWVPTDGPRISDLSAFDGIWVVPGSPYANDDAVYTAVTWARERDVPFLGTCGGLQYAVVEYVGNVLGVADASHAESDGMEVEATADDAGAEVLELPSNRFFMLSLFQPQVGALAGKPAHPLLREFVASAREAATRRGHAVAGVASSSASTSRGSEHRPSPLAR